MKNITKLALIAIFAVALAALVMGTAVAKKYRQHSDDDVWLGVTNTSVDKKLVDKYDLKSDRGALILRVADDSPAEEAGLEKRDVIIAIDGEKIYDSDDLSDALEDFEEGDEIELTYMREDATSTVTVTLDESPYGSFGRSSYIYTNQPGMRYYGSHWSHDNASYIGVQLNDIGRQLGEHFGVKRGHGALIVEVEEDSPAEEAGLKAGDVIIAINGHRVTETSDVVEDVDAAEIGEKLEITVMRDRQENTIEVEVGERDEDYLGYHHGDWGGLQALSGLSGLRGLAGLESLEALEALEEIDNIYIPRAPRAPRAPHARDVRVYSDNWDNTWIHRWSDEDDFDFDIDIDLHELEEDMRDLQDELRDMEIDLKHDFRDLRLHQD